MSFSVRDMLRLEVFNAAKSLGNGAGLDNEVKGVSIIEAPDILKFINGGEVLLTRLYAFQGYSREQFRKYLNGFSEKNVSALLLKRDESVENVEEKIAIIIEFANENNIPVFEIPFTSSYRDIMRVIMEQLFNQEVINLKYFKSTYETFSSLLSSMNSDVDGIERILKALSKLIANPVALFNQNMKCVATTDSDINELIINEKTRKYEPDFCTNYTFYKQKTYIRNHGDKVYNQYLVKMNVFYNTKLYLAITEVNNNVSNMDYIAIENGVTALKQELFHQYSIAELEKKFKNDIWNNILNGKVNTVQELRKSMNLLNIDIDADYRVLVFCLSDDKDGDTEDMNERMKYFKLLNEAILSNFPNIKILNDMDKLIIIQQVDNKQKQDVYRRELKEIIVRIQKKISSKNKNLKVWAGVGKVVEGLINIPSSFKEANDSLLFIDILGENVGEEKARLMIFSDMGIFKLLCQLDDPKQMYEYIPESLQKLYNYKKPQRDDLINTLKTYLDRNQNLAKTAQDLFIHYKTAAYRIERISDITGIDFDNPNEILAIRIGLVVYNMIENRER